MLVTVDAAEVVKRGASAQMRNAWVASDVQFSPEIPLLESTGSQKSAAATQYHEEGLLAKKQSCPDM